MTIDEKIKVLQAYKEGKTIEFKNKVHGGWSVNSNPVWDFHNSDYRVKPEPEPPKYEPFSFEDDLVGKVVVSGDEKCIIASQQHKYILVSGYDWVSYQYFLKNYTFTDGTPCGKLQTNE